VPGPQNNVMSADVARRWSDDLQRRVFAGTLNRLSVENWHELLWRARVREYKYNDLLFKQGQVADKLYVVTDGEVRIGRTDHQRSAHLARLGPGSVLGEMSFLDQSGASATVAADGKVEILFAESKDLAQLLESDQGFAARFYHSLATTLSRRLRATNELILGRF
jgi:CRP-like cAMP-binding protein